MGYLDFFRGSPDQRIAKQYMQALREAGESRRLAYDPDSRCVVSYDEHGRRHQLRSIGNLAREVLREPTEAHAAIYRRYALGSTEAAQGQRASDYALVRPRLRILLKDSSYPDFVLLQARNDFPDSKPSPLIFEHLTGDVIACCIEELDQSLRFVTQDDLARWGVDAATALLDGKANVCALPFQVSDPMPARYVINDDSFIASRFVNPAMFDGLPVKGEWVAVIPDRNTFFVADSDDSETVAGLARLALQQLEAGDRIISGLSYVLRAGRWHVYEPPEPVRALFSNVALQYRANQWAEFKTALEKDLEARGEDVFVATFAVREETGTESHHSMAVWTKGVDTILPVADRLYFYDDGASTTRVAAWHDVVRVMGAEMHREPGLPERYRVRSFPDTEQIVAMGAKII